MASTLLFVAIKDEKFIMAHIGDGVIGYLKNNELKIATQPENGEFANTTVFTTSRNAIMTMKLIKGYSEQIKGFVLMSDGTETSLYNKKEQRLAEVIKKIMQTSTIIPSVKVEEQLKYSFENIIRNTTTDDCSIAILVKECKEFRGYIHLSNTQKCELLKLNKVASKKQIRRYDNILILLLEKQSVSQIARHLHLKPKYVKKHLDKLCKLNLIEKKGDYFHTILIMNKETE